MSMIVPCGSWRSPITSNLIVAGAIGLNQPCLDGGDAYWIESRPQEKGRRVLVKHGADGQTCDVTPSGFSVRTRAHEYGGGDYTVAEGTIYFANDSDQRLYRQTRGSAPVAITGGEKFRYAEPLLDRPRQRLYAVREDHTSASVINSIVSIDPRGDPAGGMLLLSGADFYSSPRLSPSGYRLAWLQWNLPDMPWDGCELWVGELNETGAEVINRVKVAGSRNESIYQPEWSPKGVLHFVSDRTGWWNLYRWKTGKVEPLFECPAEFGVPQWVFGTSTYAVESEHLLLCSYKERGLWRMARLDTERRSIQIIETPFDHISYVTADAQHAVFIAGSAKAPESVVKLGRTGELEVLRCSSNVTVDPKYVSLPVPIEFPTENGLTAHAFYYPPKNDDFAAPPGEKPPLLVKSHGGPTSATSSTFNLSIQFWTSRGFAVVDVNYGGSTGYGRAYRERLNGQWGIVDVDDCVNAARHLVRQGLADETRLAIRGGSAGGFTTLAALTFRDVFRAGASYYGVSDLEALARDTHKFESRYLDRLVSPYPDRVDIYRERSPIRFAERLNCPLILFQGLEDKVVPTDQAVRMFEALKKKGVPVAYVPFAGEQHGFRQAANIKRALEAELFFYGKVFGFAPADEIEPVKIENLPVDEIAP